MRFRTLFFIALATVAVAAFLGVRALPEMLRARIEHDLAARLQRPVTLRALHLDPFGSVVTLEELRVGDGAGGTLLVIARAELAFEPPAPLKGPPILRRVEITGVDLRLARDAAGRWNTGDIWRAFIEEQGSPPPFSLRSLFVEDGRVEYRDETTGRTMVLSDLRVALPHLSSLPEEADVPVRPRVSGRFLGAPFHLRTLWKPFSKGTDFAAEVTFSGADLPTLAPCLPADVPLKPGAGTLAGTVQLSVAAPPDGEAEVSVTAQFRALGLDLFDPAEKLRIRIPEMEIHGCTAGGWRRGTLSFSCGGPEALGLNAREPKPPRLAAGKVTGNLTFAIASGTRGSIPSLGGTIVLERVTVSLPAREMSARIPLARITLDDPTSVGEGAGGASLALDEPELRLPRSLFENGGPAQSGPLPAAALSIRGLLVRNGRVLWSPPFPEDAPLGTLDACDLQLIHGSQPSEVLFDGRARTHYGASLRVSGTLDSSLSLRGGSATVDGLPVARLRGLTPADSPVAVEEGTARFEGRFESGGGSSGREFRFSDGVLGIRDLRLSSRPTGAEFLRLPHLEVRGIELDLPARSFAFASAEGVEGTLRLQRDAGGRLNLTFPSADPGDSARTPWMFRAGRIAFGDCALRVDDWSLPEPAGFTARRVNAEILGLSVPGGEPARVRLEAELEEGGTLTASGALAFDPPAGLLGVEVKHLSLPAFQPYYAERVAAVVVGGALSGSGTLQIAPPPGGGSPSVTYRGDLHVAGFESVDEAKWEGLLRWETLHLGGVEAGNAPSRLKVEEAALAGFFAKVELRPDATLNLLHIVRRHEAAEEEASTDVTPGAIRVGQLAVLGGTVDFTDRFIRPSYATTLRAVTGRLTDLEAGGGTAGDVDLRGRLGPQAPFEVAGKANPFREDLFADLRASCRNVDLVPFSPYAGKYAGFAIAGGKLHLEITYLLENRRLEAHGRIFLDQLALGERVVSEGGKSLPLKLAASLLKNRKGEILLEIPITGSLDELNVDIKPIARKMVRNFFLRLITSPFATLGRLFGRRGEAGAVLFAAGRSAVEGAGREGLRDLGDRLAARPALRIRIAGLFEPQEDEDGLRRVFLERRLLAERAAGRTFASTPPAPELGPEERLSLLKIISARMAIPVPKDAGGKPVPVPADTLEDLVLAYTDVDLDDLRRLALDRAEAVRDVLLEDGRVRPEQVHIVDAEALPATAAGRRTRVLYELR